MSNFQSTAPGSIWIRRRLFNPSLITSNIIFGVADQLLGAQCYLVIFNKIEGVQWSAHANIGRKGGNWCLVLSGIIGDNISKDIQVGVSGDSLVLQITNNNTYDLTISATYLSIK